MRTEHKEIRRTATLRARRSVDGLHAVYALDGITAIGYAHKNGSFSAPIIDGPNLWRRYIGRPNKTVSQRRNLLSIIEDSKP